MIIPKTAREEELEGVRADIVPTAQLLLWPVAISRDITFPSSHDDGFLHDLAEPSRVGGPTIFCLVSRPFKLRFEGDSRRS